MFPNAVFIFFFSANIESLVDADDVAASVDKFMELSKLYSTLQISKCHNIVKFIKDTTVFWYKILKNKMARCV